MLFSTLYIQPIDIVGRVFDSVPGDRGSMSGHSYQRLKKWYLIPPCFTLTIIKYVSRVKWNNLGKGIPPFPTPQRSSKRKESLWVALDYSQRLYIYIYIYIYIQCKLCIISTNVLGKISSNLMPFAINVIKRCYEIRGTLLLIEPLSGRGLEYDDCISGRGIRSIRKKKNP